MFEPIWIGHRKQIRGIKHKVSSLVLNATSIIIPIPQNSITNHMEPIYEKNGNKLIWHEDLKCIQIDWSRFIKKLDMVEMRNEADKLFISKKPENWIANMAETAAVEKDGQDYGAQVWVPEVASKGIKRMATVLPASALGKLGSRKIVTAFNDTYATCEASSIAEAINWIANEMKS